MFVWSGGRSWLDQVRLQLHQVSGLPQKDQNSGREMLHVVPRDGEDLCLSFSLISLRLKWESISQKMLTPVFFLFLSLSLFLHLKRHDECLYSGISSCNCGPFRDHILPPWAIYAVSKVKIWSLLNKIESNLLVMYRFPILVSVSVPIPGLIFLPG